MWEGRFQRFLAISLLSLHLFFAAAFSPGFACFLALFSIQEFGKSARALQRTCLWTGTDFILQEGFEGQSLYPQSARVPRSKGPERSYQSTNTP